MGPAGDLLERALWSRRRLADRRAYAPQQCEDGPGQGVKTMKSCKIVAAGAACVPGVGGPVLLGCSGMQAAPSEGNPRAQKQLRARHLSLDGRAVERVPGAACAWQRRAFLYISLVQHHEARREPSVKNADECRFCMR